MDLQETFLVLFILSLCSMTILSLCPCSDPSLCKPISTTPDHEIFIFSLQNDTFTMYDWTKVTTVAISGAYKPEKHSALLCYAHSKGARFVQMVICSVSTLKNTTQYRQWIAKQVDSVVKNHLDGINIDFESALSKEEAPLLNKVTQELAVALKAKNKNYQVSFDFAWSPDCIDDRCYDYKTLGDIVDLVFVMSYDERNHDERSGVKSPCIAWANSAANTTTHGVVEFLKLGIPPRKMILGLPWYGYIYDCISVNKDNVCRIEPKDTGCKLGSQIPYKTVMENMLHNSTSGRLWDHRAATSYFTLENPKTRGYRQVWYDDPASLGIKYDVANNLNLRGVGMWFADALDYSNAPLGAKMRQQMWGALPKYKRQ